MSVNRGGPLTGLPPVVQDGNPEAPLGPFQCLHIAALSCQEQTLQPGGRKSDTCTLSQEQGLKITRCLCKMQWQNILFHGMKNINRGMKTRWSDTSRVGMLCYAAGNQTIKCLAKKKVEKLIQESQCSKTLSLLVAWICWSSYCNSLAYSEEDQGYNPTSCFSFHLTHCTLHVQIWGLCSNGFCRLRLS